MQFTSEIKIRGVNPYIFVTKDIATEIKPNWKKPLPVLVKINATPQEPWQLNMMPTGDGNFYLYLHGNIRNTTNTKVGDVVNIDITFDENYHGGPTHPLPAWFSSALENNIIAKENWNKLIPSRKKEVIRYFSSLKSSEAKTRNLQQVLHVLSGNPGRFMARSWNKGK